MIVMMMIGRDSFTSFLFEAASNGSSAANIALDIKMQPKIIFPK